jgi:putative membrane protein
MEVVAHAGEWGEGPWPWIGPLWLVFFAAAVMGLVMFMRRGSRRAASASPSGPTATAESVLAERYARGEMTDDEYLAKVSVLRSGDK